MRPQVDPNNESNYILYVPFNSFKATLNIGMKGVSKTNPLQAWYSLKFILKTLRTFPELGTWVFAVSVPKNSIVKNTDEPTSAWILKSIPKTQFVSVFNSKGKEVWKNDAMVAADEMTTSGNMGSYPNNPHAWGKPEDYKGDLTSFEDGHPAPAGTEEVSKVLGKKKEPEELTDARVVISKIDALLTQRKTQ